MALANTPEARVAGALRSDPLFIPHVVLGQDLWSKQREIIGSVFGHRRTSVKSCHASGKTFTAAMCTLAWLYRYPGSKVITTAPTARQVRELLWREIRVAYKRARYPLGGRMYQVPRLEISDDWFAFGFSTDEPESFQGPHGEYVLIIVDEASGVDAGIFEAIEGVMSAGETHLLLIGNPTKVSGNFYDSHHSERDIYNPITIAAQDTPNFTGEGRYPQLIRSEWVEERKRVWGETSPAYQVRVLGRFPRQGVDTLIWLEWVEAAAERPVDIEDATRYAPEYGVDVARFGDDESGVYLRRGPHVLEGGFWQGMDTEFTAGRVADMVRTNGKGTVKVDAVGIGAGVADKLRGLGFDVVDVVAGAQASDPEKYPNLRAEMWWGLRNRFRDGDIRGVTDDITQGQLTTVKYRYDERTRVVIESKDKAKARGVASPDRAEALMLAFYSPPAIDNSWGAL
jgi:hypothetical protein